MTTLIQHIQQDLDKPVRGLDLIEMYKKMFLIRRTEEAILELRRTDLIAGSVHLCVGQESAPVGVIAALSDHDRTLATYRGHGWALGSGLPLRALFSEVLGRANGINGGRAGSPYLVAPEYGFIGEVISSSKIFFLSTFPYTDPVDENIILFILFFAHRLKKILLFW